MEKKIAALLLVVVACAGRAEAHIHSQKVRHIEPDKLTSTTWLLALVSSALVGACGLFPMLLNRWVRLDASYKDSVSLRAVLSFAVGGLLGDVFLHLLPEAWGSGDGRGERGWRLGMWVLAGLLAFMIVEKLVKCTESELMDGERSKVVSESNCIPLQNGHTSNTPNGNYKKPQDSNGFLSGSSFNFKAASSIDISGYLNLVANCTDNFTHGLAIAASYVANPAVGLLTTLAILCHEIPHEIGDFAILLNSGFSLKGAAKAQMLTACGGLVGVVVGLTAEHFSSSTQWLLPFTAGGFLYIALVSIVPELLDDGRGAWHSVLEMCALVLGVVIMAMVTIIEKKSCGHMP